MHEARRVRLADGSEVIVHYDADSKGAPVVVKKIVGVLRNGRKPSEAEVVRAM